MNRLLPIGVKSISGSTYTAVLLGQFSTAGDGDGWRYLIIKSTTTGGNTQYGYYDCFGKSNLDLAWANPNALSFSGPSYSVDAELGELLFLETSHHGAMETGDQFRVGVPTSLPRTSQQGLELHQFIESGFAIRSRRERGRTTPRLFRQLPLELIGRDDAIAHLRHRSRRSPRLRGSLGAAAAGQQHQGEQRGGRSGKVGNGRGHGCVRCSSTPRSRSGKSPRLSLGRKPQAPTFTASARKSSSG